MPDDLDDKIRAAMKVLDGETPSGYFEAVPNQILARLEDGSMQHGSGTTDFRKNADALMGPPVVPEDADTNPTPKVEASDVGPLPTKPAAKPVVAAAVAAKPAAAPAPTETAPASASSTSMSAADRDEDSGLHDIRNLAQSTKQRLSARRITQQPPTNDDVLASSSGSFAGIALPQPAKMVSLPEIEDLPSKQEVIAAQKAAAKARKEKKPTIEPTLASKEILAPQATANAALSSMTVAPVAATEAAATDLPPVRSAFSLPSQQNKKSKGPLIAILGLGAAAAAGAFIFMGNGGEKKAETVAAASTDTAVKQEVAAPAAAPAATVEPIAAAGSAAAEPAPAPVEEAPEAAAAVVADDDKDDQDEAKASRKRGAAKSAKKDVEEKKVEAKVEEPKVDAPKEIKTPDGTKKVKGEGEGEPSFDALLKEAGVEDKKVEKPKLEKKSLSGDDFKKGMAAIQAKAQGCYKGTQGTASVKLTVGPDGKVTKASVGGQFAGKPEASCVEAAVKGASFPAWDGGPQSFNYSYMLAD